MLNTLILLNVLRYLLLLAFCHLWFKDVKIFIIFNISGFLIIIVDWQTLILIASTIINQTLPGALNKLQALLLLFVICNTSTKSKATKIPNMKRVHSFSELIAIIDVELRIGLVTWIRFSHFCFPATCRNVASTLASTCLWPYYLLCSHGHGLPGVHCVGQLCRGLDADCAVDWVGIRI